MFLKNTVNSAYLEDLDVGSEQVLALHALLSGHGPHKEGGVDVLKVNHSLEIFSCHPRPINAQKRDRGINTTLDIQLEYS